MTAPEQEPAYVPPVYTPPTLRIAATYPNRQIGDYAGLPDGHPDNVEVEINLNDRAALTGEHVGAEFITALIGALFRYAAETPEISVTQTFAQGGPLTSMPAAGDQVLATFAQRHQSSWPATTTTTAPGAALPGDDGQEAA